MDCGFPTTNLGLKAMLEHVVKRERELKRVVLLLETSRAFGRDLLHGIARNAKHHGPWTFYREPQDLRSFVPRLAGWKADGMIMRNTHANRSNAEIADVEFLLIDSNTKIREFKKELTGNDCAYRMFQE